MRKGAGFVFRTVCALGFLAALAGGVASWRLMRGPVSLDVFIPYIEDAVSAQARTLGLKLGEIRLVWEGASRAVELIARDIAVVDADGAVIASAPEIQAALDPLALLRGEARPRMLEILSPHIHLVRLEDGRIELGLWSPAAAPPGEKGAPAGQDGGFKGAQALRMLLRTLTAPAAAADDELGIARGLQGVEVIDADATLVDRRLGAVWTAPRVNIELLRENHGVAISAALVVAAGDGAAGRLTLAGEYRPRKQALDVDVKADGLRPASFASLGEGFGVLAALDLPISGSAAASFAVSDTLRLRSATVRARGGAGTLRPPALAGWGYDVAGLSLTATVAPDPGAVTLTSLRLDLGGPTVEASGAGALDATGAARGEVTLRLAGLPLEDLERYWPPDVAPGPRGWIVNNLEGGRLTEGVWRLHLAGDRLRTLDVVDFSGRLRVEGATVHYLRPMAPVVGAAATIRYAPRQVRVAVEKGHVGAVRLTHGAIDFLDLDKDDSRAVVNLTAEGPLRDALRALDSKPLMYPRKLGLDPAMAGGRARADVKLAFPLLKDLPLSALVVEARVSLSAASLKNGVFGRDVTGGEISLRIDANGLDARGQAVVGGVPAGFSWRENFGGDPFASRYVVNAVVEEDKRGAVGLDFPPFTPEYMRGPVGVTLELTDRGEAGSTLGVRADLSDARLYAPGIEWVKPAGEAATATAAARLNPGGIVVDIPHVLVRAPDVAIEGRVELSDEGAFKALDLSRARIGESDLTLRVVRRGSDAPLRVIARGAALDATAFIDPPEDAPDRSGTPDFQFDGRFDRVKVSPGGAMTDVRLRTARRSDRWTRISLKGLQGDGAPFAFALGPGPEGGRRRFTLTSPNAGGFLADVGFTDAIRGGALSAEGEVTPQGVATGSVRIDSYRVANAPVLAKLLSVAALTGVLDTLTGEGIAFEALDAPFVYDSAARVATLKDFRAYGASLGVTGAGAIDFETGEVDLKGTLVPVYMLNSLVGRLPLIGRALTGFEKGGGVFAAAYSIKGRAGAPEISVNPLSALAPGFLRGVFGGVFPRMAPGDDRPQNRPTPKHDPLIGK